MTKCFDFLLIDDSLSIHIIFVAHKDSFGIFPLMISVQLDPPPKVVETLFSGEIDNENNTVCIT